MGTNYYWHEQPPCECCGRDFEVTHIGKSSGGWVFALHVYPDNGINTLSDWKKRFRRGRIFDEYGKLISAKEMGEIISDRGHSSGWDRNWYSGYKSEEEFHRLNYSQRGPKGLLRSVINRHCIGHGRGTWDYFVGEFS